MLETAEYEFKDPAELNDNEILHMLTIADDLSKWAEDVYSYAQAKAINEGKSWSGFKIVEGRSKRQYVDENKIAAWFSGSREEEAYLLQKLVDAGNTVIVIEHNLDVIKVADHIIDIGPEGGAAGGEIVAAGTPHEVARCKRSYTGEFLKKLGL